MAAITLRRDRAQTGVRPFDPYRDLRSVVELMSTAFGDTLGPDGQVVLAEMFRIARWGSLLWWLYWPGWSRAGGTSGFVWTDQGRVVGNVSLRRACGWGGFLIGNLAVHPDWQGRGIASALMKTVLEAISARGGRWVGLEVRADNQVARHLYGHLGFREVGRTLYMLRPAGLPWAGNPPTYPPLRRGCRRDSAALIALVRSIVPESQRPLLELRKENYRPGWERTLDRWLEGRHEAWWVVEDDGVVCGAVRTLRVRGCRPDRLEVLVDSGHSGRLETVLVRQGMASLRGAAKKMVGAVLPNPAGPLITALKAVGFQKLRVLAQMRLDLARRIP